MLLQAGAQHLGANGHHVPVILPGSDELFQHSTHNFMYKRWLRWGFLVPQQDTEHTGGHWEVLYKYSLPPQTFTQVIAGDFSET